MPPHPGLQALPSCSENGSVSGTPGVHVLMELFAELVHERSSSHTHQRRVETLPQPCPAPGFSLPGVLPGSALP